MRTKLIAIGLLAFLLPLCGASYAPKSSVRADSVLQDEHTITFKGRAIAVFGEFQISADKMILDRDTGILRCIGEAIMTGSTGTMTAINAQINTKENTPSVRADSMRISPGKRDDTK